MKVSSNRGYIKAKAVVTKRIRTLKVDGKDIDTIGIPIHWGYEGVAKKKKRLYCQYPDAVRR